MALLSRFIRWTAFAGAASAVVLSLASCGGSATGPFRARIGGVVPPLTDVKWVPQYPLGSEPSVFNEPPLRGNVVVLDFYASW